ncbi:hypothetical protein [Rhodanobacter geophilus]|uniref:Inovirus Gp2 family protein n=1 Tax=Rhodanobacter geophilus TaxID=3162488 RepID=A0ABV3QKY6_9GAMM
MTCISRTNNINEEFKVKEAEKNNIGKRFKPDIMEDMQREIAASERRYQRLSKGIVRTSDGCSHITEEIDLPYHIERMASVTKRIVAGSENAVELGTGKGLLTYGHFEHRLTWLGTKIRDICMDIVPHIEQAYPSCRRVSGLSVNITLRENPHDFPRMDDLKIILNPFLTVMLRACQRIGPTLCRYGGKNLDVDAPAVARAFDHLLRFVRRVCRSKKFRRIVNNYGRNARENFRACCRYMASKFAEHSRLLILRVDFYIAPEHKVWAMTEDANRCIHNYLRTMRESRIVPDVKAWICKRENGFRRGIHYHLLAAMDGHKHREAATYSRLLGEAWQRRYSGGLGTYFNCWTRRGEYSINCLGLVHVSDRMKLLGLREAIKYMTKEDFQVDTGYARDLWKGVTRRSWASVKRGAPRKLQHDLAIVSEILGDA